MWAPIIAAIIQVLLPLFTKALMEWLEKLLNQTAGSLPSPGLAAVNGDPQATLLQAAIDQTPWYMFSRRIWLRRFQKALV